MKGQKYTLPILLAFLVAILASGLSPVSVATILKEPIFGTNIVQQSELHHVYTVKRPALSNASSITFAVIGDYGQASQSEQDVANLVKSWKPDVIITTGDNNYPGGSQATIDQNIGKYYHRYISSYKGSYGSGASLEEFFPSLGNHDWAVPGASAYKNFFSLPGNQRYYDFYWGPVEFFALDSDPHEPDGVTQNSVQARWLKAELAISTARWKVVYFHHPPFTSGTVHGASDWMRWPFARWGATAVLSGHDHIYERLSIDGIPYFVNGLGGAEKYGFGVPVKGSQARYAGDYGAMLVKASLNKITFQFISRKGKVIDTYSMTKQSIRN
jgi:hypothetical protein